MGRYRLSDRACRLPSELQWQRAALYHGVGHGVGVGVWAEVGMAAGVWVGMLRVGAGTLVAVAGEPAEGVRVATFVGVAVLPLEAAVP